MLTLGRFSREVSSSWEEGTPSSRWSSRAPISELPTTSSSLQGYHKLEGQWKSDDLAFLRRFENYRNIRDSLVSGEACLKSYLDLLVSWCPCNQFSCRVSESPNLKKRWELSNYRLHRFLMKVFDSQILRLLAQHRIDRKTCSQLLLWPNIFG